MLESVEAFVKYSDGIRRRTLNYIRALPTASLDWSPKPGEFTCRDIICHVAASEMMLSELPPGGGGSIWGTRIISRIRWNSCSTISHQRIRMRMPYWTR